MLLCRYYIAHYIGRLARYTTKYMQFDLIRLSYLKVYYLDIPSPIITKVIMTNTMKCILIMIHLPKKALYLNCV